MFYQELAEYPDLSSNEQRLAAASLYSQAKIEPDPLLRQSMMQDINATVQIHWSRWDDPPEHIDPYTGMPYTDEMAKMDDDDVRAARLMLYREECPLTESKVIKYHHVNGKLVKVGEEIWDEERVRDVWSKAQMGDHSRDIAEEQEYLDEVHSTILTDEKGARELQESLQQTWQEPVPRRLVLMAPLEQRFLSAEEVNDILVHLVFRRGHVSEETLSLLAWDEEPSEIQLMDLLERYGWLLQDEGAVVQKLGVRFMRNYASGNSQMMLEAMSDPRDTGRDDPGPQDARLYYAADLFEKELEEHFEMDEADHQQILENMGRKPYLASPVYNMTRIRAIASGVSADEANDMAWEDYKRYNDRAIITGANVHGLKTERGTVTWSKLPRAIDKGLRMPEGNVSQLLAFLKENGVQKGVEAIESCRSLLSAV